MASLVAQLQADALDRAVPVTDLLRKAKVTAVKLGLGEFRTWVDRELNGYEQEEVPSYRHVRGEPKGFNPFHGWQPVIFHNAPKHQEALSERWIAQSVSALEDLAREAEGPLMMPYAASVMDALNRGADGPPTHYALFTDRAALAHVIDAVRNAVLDWALKLEQAGIVGEELSFSETEKAKARAEHRLSNRQDREFRRQLGAGRGGRVGFSSADAGCPDRGNSRAMRTDQKIWRYGGTATRAARCP